MEKINNLLRRTAKKWRTSIFLITLWILLTLFYIFNNSFSLSIISYSHNKNNFVNFSTNRIFAGEKVTGEFKAQENYLGIVTVSFATFNQVSYADEDTLRFRIKEKGTQNWYYENTYRSGLVYEVPIYPFGFPKISDSKGKNYVFEIESLTGNSLNAVALSNWEPVLVTRYQIPKSELLKSKINLAEFFLRRIIIAFGDREVIFFSSIYFLPFVFYLIFYVRPIRKIVDKAIAACKKRIYQFAYSIPPLRPFIHVYNVLSKAIAGNLDIILFAVVLINIFLVPVINDVALIVVIILWIYLAKIYKNTSRETFIVGLFLLSFSPLLLLFSFNNIAEKMAVWAYMFFVAGAIQILLELKPAKINEKN